MKRKIVFSGRQMSFLLRGLHDHKRELEDPDEAECADQLYQAIRTIVMACTNKKKVRAPSGSSLPAAHTQ